MDFYGKDQMKSLRCIVSFSLQLYFLAPFRVFKALGWRKSVVGEVVFKLQYFSPNIL